MKNSEKRVRASKETIQAVTDLKKSSKSSGKEPEQQPIAASTPTPTSMERVKTDDSFLGEGNGDGNNANNANNDPFARDSKIIRKQEKKERKKRYEAAMEQQQEERRDSILQWMGLS